MKIIGNSRTLKVGLSIRIESYFASDLSTANLTYCKQNAEEFKVPVEIKQGSLFKPWDNYKFDTIINDVSGIYIII